MAHAKDVAYSWNIVQVEMGFLDGLSMVSLRVGQTEKTLLEERTTWRQISYLAHARFEHILLLVPESKSNVLLPVGISDTSNTIFTPTEGSGSGVIMGEIWRRWVSQRYSCCQVTM
jgi:hypothetical protein